MSKPIWIRLRSVLERDADATSVELSRESAEEMLAEIKRLTAENAKLREVLEPFAKAAYGFDGYNIKDPEEWFAYSGTGAITVGDLRRARAELSGDKHE